MGSYATLMRYLRRLQDPQGSAAPARSRLVLVASAPRRFQSGQRDYDGRISKCGDAMMRTALYEAAQVLLTRTRTWSWLKALNRTGFPGGSNS